MTVEIIEPHGLCAGVNAAIAKALTLKDVWCLHELVHNEIVLEDLKALGYRFVDRIEDVPEGETVVFSAHGVSPAVRAAAKARRLKVVDTTCPFVAKVHKAARAFADRGLPVVIIGDPSHVETKGVAGEVPNPIFYSPNPSISQSLIRTFEQSNNRTFSPGRRLADDDERRRGGGGRRRTETDA